VALPDLAYLDPLLDIEHLALCAGVGFPQQAVEGHESFDAGSHLAHHLDFARPIR
jgi:hypothetical protein